MLLALEIALTVAAWRKGWKGWALVPAGIGLGLGFLAGVAAAAGGASGPDGLVPLGLLVDGGVIVSLAVMAWHGRGAVTTRVATGYPAGSRA